MWVQRPGAHGKLEIPLAAGGWTCSRQRSWSRCFCPSPTSWSTSRSSSKPTAGTMTSPLPMPACVCASSTQLLVGATLLLHAAPHVLLPCCRLLMLVLASRHLHLQLYICQVQSVSTALVSSVICQACTCTLQNYSDHCGSTCRQLSVDMHSLSILQQQPAVHSEGRHLSGFPCRHYCLAVIYHVLCSSKADVSKHMGVLHQLLQCAVDVVLLCALIRQRQCCSARYEFRQCSVSQSRQARRKQSKPPLPAWDTPAAQHGAVPIMLSRR